MWEALQKLGAANRTCSAHLANLLDEIGVRMSLDGAGDTSGCRGGAFFGAFDPWHTCLQLPPYSFRYFHDAVRFGLISNAEAHELSYQLAVCCADLRNSYKGRFLPHLQTGEFRDFLENLRSPRELAQIESARGGWCADLFTSAFRWPVQPALHLDSSGSSRKIKLERTLSPLLGIGGALELVAWGPWLGFTAEDIRKGLEWLRSGAPRSMRDRKVQSIGEHVVIPCFSHGFQGVVVGFFHDLKNEQREPVLNLLRQFGQSLADAYASLRRLEFHKAVRERTDAKSLAQAVTRIASPMEHVVVEAGDQYHGYVLREEEEYWAGYDEMTGQDAAALAQDRENEHFAENFGGKKVRIMVKPIGNQPALDRTFTRVGLQARLSELLVQAGDRAKVIPITARELEDHLSNLQHHLPNPNFSGEVETAWGAFAKYKRLCLGELILDNFTKGEININNSMMKNRLEKRLARGQAKVTGYQITGKALHRFKLELGDFFKDRFIFESIGRDRVRVSWAQA